MALREKGQNRVGGWGWGASIGLCILLWDQHRSEGISPQPCSFCPGACQVQGLLLKRAQRTGPGQISKGPSLAPEPVPLV